MKFRYVGNPLDLKDLHPQITAFGLVFPLDESVEVTEPRAVRKLKNNTHFEAVSGDDLASEADADDAGATITHEAPPAASEDPVLTTAPLSPATRSSRRRG